ncbi:Transcriptional regulator, TetR family [Candidatus Phaeomarinobacter ectocarpi]|uniref:Transcriptional regulator, TetR family n=1 Tax=Candidatus Phaeomarinibacter ectocarpi TaxID=1458461 RepID=X5M839_9HYPH|nr:TetR/AcrR family transcriptional regulator [Candidatus Phaeomarinobacter ectocarpi]CDO59423.1 Transcriptional regulator, TetR family [Candidatus Phaeomarinobacter ectocarpi]
MQRARTDDAKDERRQALLSAALEVFVEKSFAAARMDDIARAASLSKGTVYLYFSSKEDLFEAVLRNVALPKVEHIENLMRDAPSVGEALDGIGLFVPHLIRETALPRIIKLLISESGMFPEIVQSYREDVLDRLLGGVTGLLARAKAAGEIEVGDPALAARLVAAPIAFSALWSVVFETVPEARVDIDALMAMHVTHLKRALGVIEEVSA